MLTMKDVPHFLLSLVCASLLLMSSVASRANSSPSSDSDIIEKLKEMKVEDLIEVEVTLDDVFDIFDALVAVKKTTVATGAEQSTIRAPAVTTVITAQDIEAIGATDLDEVLESVPGLHVSRSFNSNNSTFSMRGMISTSDPQVLMMINGVPINTLYTGGRNYVWGGMPVNGIARIEIIRGPGSALFGADAFAGVINIITKGKGDLEGTEVGARVGRNHTKDAWILHGGKWAGNEVAASVEYHTTDGPNRMVEADAQTLLDQQLSPFGIPPVSLAPGNWNLQQNTLDTHLDLSRSQWRLHLGYQGRYDMGMGFTPLQVLDPSTLHEENRWLANLTYHNPLVADHWDVTAELSYLDIQTDSASDLSKLSLPGVTMPVPTPAGMMFITYPEGIIFNFGLKERQTRFNLSSFYSGFAKHKVRMGTGYFVGETYDVQHITNVDPLTGQPIPISQGLLDLSDTPSAVFPRKDRSNWYVFVQDSWAFLPDWELTAGLRYDSYSDFGTTLNPRLALVWQTRPSLTTKLLYGRAFRAPSFIELYTNMVLLGNPNLDPETIDTGELALDYYLSDTLHIGLNFFSYRWRDIIITSQLATDGSFRAENRGDKTGRGMEIEARWKVLKNVSVLANYAYQQTYDKDDQMTNRFPTAYLRTDWLVIPNWYLDTQLNWLGKRDRTSAMDLRPSLAATTQVDVTLRYKDIRDGRWNVALGLRNVFDEDIREAMSVDNRGIALIPNDLPQAGRHYFLEFRYRF